MKPAAPGTFNKRARAKINSQQKPKAEDLFLPSVIEVVKHLARVAAESDYKHFLATGQLPFAQPEQEDRDD